jgi:hypothetical protein
MPPDIFDASSEASSSSRSVADAMSDSGGMACMPGELQVCGGSVGTCMPGMRLCTAIGQWTACLGQVDPVQEVCDGLDNDCNGVVDDGLAACPLGCSPGPSKCELCVAGTAKCLTANSSGTCASTANRWIEVSCATGCNALSGKCNICQPGVMQCLFSPTTSQSAEQICRSDGSGFDTRSCAAFNCSIGTGTCQVCFPGTKRCLGQDSEETCFLDGSGWGPPQTCTAMLGCLDVSGCNVCMPNSCYCSTPAATTQCGPYGHPTGTYYCANNGQGTCQDGRCTGNNFSYCDPHANTDAGVSD